jgi:ferrochelatase
VAEAPAKTGVLLINLGTPDGTDFASMRRYLKEFLSDKRVVEATGPLWWLIFHGIILTRRPRRSGRAYARIWDHARNESPLRGFTRAQARALGAALAGRPGIVVDWAMRYGTPSIAQGIERLIGQGCERILFFPLYPQYSSATTGTAMDRVFDALKTLRHQPAVRSVAPYFDHPAHIAALATGIRAHHAGLSWQPEVIIASLHGLPTDFVAKGDPYRDQCEVTVDLLRRELGLGADRLLLSYQSRAGRREWIGPDTETLIRRLAGQGVRNLSLVAPGFAADGVETLEELGLRATRAFLDAGGENVTLVPCLNAGETSIAMLKTLVLENLGGWAQGGDQAVVA